MKTGQSLRHGRVGEEKQHNSLTREQRQVHTQIGPEGRTTRGEAAMRVRTHPPIAADFPLPVPLFVSENPEGFRPDN